MEKKRILWVDALNVVACAGVLLLHSTNAEVHNFQGAVSFNWCLGLLTHSFFLWPVNVFFMLSGFTLLKNSLMAEGGGKIFYTKRLRRLLIPVLGWNIIYTLLNLASQYKNFGTVDSPIAVIEKFLSFEYNGFMWFFVPLICIYLSMPFLAVFVLNAKRKTLRLFLIISLALGCLAPLHSDFSARSNLIDIYIFGTRFIPFTVAGYYLGNYDISRETRRKLYMAAGICIFIMIVGTACLQFLCPEHYKYFIQYTNIPCSIVSFAVFVLFRYTDWEQLLVKIRITPSRLATMCSLSLGIYLIQYFGFMIVRHFGVIDDHMILTFVVMYIGCALAVWLMKKIPVINKLV